MAHRSRRDCSINRSLKSSTVQVQSKSRPWIRTVSGQSFYIFSTLYLYSLLSIMEVTKEVEKYIFLLRTDTEVRSHILLLGQ